MRFNESSTIKYFIVIIIGFAISTAVSASVLLGHWLYLIIASLVYLSSGFALKKIQSKVKINSIDLIIFLFPNIVISFFTLFAYLGNVPDRFPFGFFYSITGLYIGFYTQDIIRNKVLIFWCICWLISVSISSLYIIPQLANKEAQASYSNYNIIDNFPLYTLDSTLVSQKIFKDKVVVLDFSWSGCGPCIMKFPYYSKISNKFKNQKDIVFIVVNVGEYDSIKKAKEFKGKYMPSLLWLYDKDSYFEKELGLRAAPVEVIIDKKGKIRKVELGFNKDLALIYLDEKYDYLKSLLEEKY